MPFLVDMAHRNELEPRMPCSALSCKKPFAHGTHRRGVPYLDDRLSSCNAALPVSSFKKENRVE